MRVSSPLLSAITASLVLALTQLPCLVTARHLNSIYHPKYIHSSAKCLQGRYLIELATTSDVDDMLHWMTGQEELGVKVHKTFKHRFFSGLSIEVLDNESIGLLLDKASVVSMSANRMIQRASPIPPIERAKPSSDSIFTPETIRSLMPHNASQVNKARQELNLTGQGVFVGIIDSGIDYTLKALGGGFGPGFKVIAGYDLVGDRYNSTDPLSMAKADSDPLDNCGRNSSADGHGTHVAGIIAGYDPENNFEGVAPGASLGMWRVFSCDGESTTDEVLLDALIMAYEAGVHIISMSIGSTQPFSDDSVPLVKVVNQITAADVSVVVAAGNEGSDGVYSISAPSTALSALAVASVVNQVYNPPYKLNITGLDEAIDAYPPGDDTKAFINGSLAIANSNNTALTEDACDRRLVSTSVKGKIALVKRGSCQFTTKAKNVESAGAVGVIFYNNVDEELDSINAEGSIPAVSISLQNGLKLLNLLSNATRDIEVMAVKINGYIANPKANTVSTFSSIGPTAELYFKPNIAAVGQTVFSTLPKYLGGYGIRDGTSMACPYISGSLALYLQYYGTNQTDVAAMHTRFKNYALPLHVGKASSNVTDNPIRQGAGLVQVYDAITQPVQISPPEISFNDSSSSNYLQHNLTITNNAIYPVSYSISSKISTGIEPYNQTGSAYNSLNRPAVNREATSTIQFSQSQMHLNPGESQVVTVTVTPPSAGPQKHIMYGGFIQFDPLNVTSTLASIHIPYIGVSGSQRDLPIFADSIQSYYNNASNIIQTADQVTYKFNSSRSYFKTDYFVLVKFGLINPTKVLKAELLRQQDKQVLGHVMFPATNVPATPKGNDMYIGWNGYYFNNTAVNLEPDQVDARYAIPSTNGSYLIQLSALKLLGNPRNDADWETWRSGIINVFRV
ncbi:peptidase S8/S53 domain-containing protein, partial [Mucor lusitanicus]